MAGRLENKVAIVVGAGQTPGDTMGNGRAISILFAREGAKVMLVDRRLGSAEETGALIAKEGGEAFAFQADATRPEDCRRIPEKCLEKYGRIDILVNVVGIGTGDRRTLKINEEDWDRIFEVNVKTMFMTCKHVVPIMMNQESGSIINISSVAAVAGNATVAYKASKAGVNALTQSIAMRYAGHGIRANALMLGLMETPMAIEGISQAVGMSKEELIRQRNANVPLKGGMGSAWDTAYAALFLASDEARFITSVMLPVDGGQSGKVC